MQKLPQESWRVSVFFLIFMILSWLAEYGFHIWEHYLKHKGQTSMKL